jgi:hypothetical protein
MKKIYLALNWGFGILFLLTGLLSFVVPPLGRLSLILISLLLLSRVRCFVYSRTNRELPLKVRSLAILLLSVAFGVSVVDSQIRKERGLSFVEKQEMAQKRYARSQKDHIEFFGVDTWNHGEYVKDNGVGLCLVCHSLGTDGPNMSGRGPRCPSCHGIE